MTEATASADTALAGYYNTPGDICVERGEGVHVFDRDGRRYIDCSAGTFNLSLGYSHPEVVAVVRDQAERLIHLSSAYQAEPVNELVAALVEIAPAPLTKVHLKSAGGSLANEGAVKIAQHATGRDEVITLFRSHLGQSALTASMSGSSFRRARLPHPLPGLVQVPDPYCLRCFYRQSPETCGFLCVDRIADFIECATSGRVACIVVEPISGNGGNVVPPAGWFGALRRLCDEHDVLLVLDEIQTGFGRTGEMFAADYFGVEPNIMTVAKGLGGSGLPIAAILTEERLAGLEASHHAFTFGGNVLAAAAAVKTIEVIRRPGFLEHVRRMGCLVMDRLLDVKARHRVVGDVRGVGLMIGVEVVDRRGEPDGALARLLAERAPEYGLLLRTSANGCGNVVKIRPPLTIAEEEALDMCDRLERLIAAEA